MRRQVMAALSLNDHVSSCWKCNTNDSMTHISWRCMKTTQLWGSFIRPANVILITSSISAHMSWTNAGNAESFSLSLSHTHDTHTSCSPAFLCFTSHCRSSISDKQMCKKKRTPTHTCTPGGMKIQYANWWWHVKQSVRVCAYTYMLFK